MKKTILLITLLFCSAASASITQLDTENADCNLVSTATVLTDTPSATDNMLCQVYIKLGDGTKNLDGTGGNFSLTIEVGSQTVQPGPQTVTFGTAARASIWSGCFPCPANEAVIVKVLSPNAADTDVDVTAYLYDVHTQTGDSYALANGATGFTAIDTVVDAILTDTAAMDTSSELKTLLCGADANLSTLTEALVESNVGDAIVTYNLDHLTKTAVSDANDMTEIVDNTALAWIMTDDGDVNNFDFSTDSLEGLYTLIDWIRDVTEGDEYIITSTTPYQLEIYIKGDTKGTDTPLIEKDLKDVSGNNLTSQYTVIGQKVEP